MWLGKRMCILVLFSILTDGDGSLLSRSSGVRVRYLRLCVFLLHLGRGIDTGCRLSVIQCHIAQSTFAVCMTYLGARGMPEHIQRPHVDNMEALKAPVFILWSCLDMERRENCPKKALGGSGWRVLYLRPGEYLDECLSLLRGHKIPISEYDGGTRLKQTLIDFYADMIEMYERG